MAPVICSARLDLRPIDDEDVEAIVTLHADPRVAAQLVDTVPDTPALARRLLYWNLPMAAQGYGTFAVRRRGDPALIGLFALTPFDGDAGRLELGGRLHPSAWRGGLAVEAGAALINNAFGTLGRDHLMSAFHPDHRAAPVSLARLGFHPDANVTLYGRCVATMRLDREDWIAQDRAPLPARALSRSDYGATPLRAAS